jgi:hypothetical protein
VCVFVVVTVSIEAEKEAIVLMSQSINRTIDRLIDRSSISPERLGRPAWLKGGG